MKDFVILTDSTCDLPKELRQQYGIEYVAMNYTIDGTEYAASLDWESHGAKEYYDLMRKGTRVFTTQVPKNVYYDAFRAAVEAGIHTPNAEGMTVSSVVIPNPRPEIFEALI